MTNPTGQRAKGHQAEDYWLLEQYLSFLSKNRMSQENFARLSGLTGAWLTQFRFGRRSPRFYVAARMCKAMAVNLNSVYAECPEPRKRKLKTQCSGKILIDQLEER